MKKVWEIPQIESEFLIVSKEEFEQRLDEWAEIVYRHICQLQKDQAEVSETLTKRTGTDG